MPQYTLCEITLRGETESMFVFITKEKTGRTTDNILTHLQQGTFPGKELQELHKHLKSVTIKTIHRSRDREEIHRECCFHIRSLIEKGLLPEDYLLTNRVPDILVSGNYSQPFYTL